MRPTKNKEPNTKMDKEYKAIEMLKDLNAYITLSGAKAPLSRIVPHDLTAIAEVLHTGSTRTKMISEGSSEELDAKFAGQINEWN